MQYDPEDILHRSGLDAMGATLFLHENFPSFVDDAAIDDTAAMAAQLSDAGTIPYLHMFHIQAHIPHLCMFHTYI